MVGPFFSDLGTLAMAAAMSAYGSLAVRVRCYAYAGSRPKTVTQHRFPNRSFDSNTINILNKRPGTVMAEQRAWSRIRSEKLICFT